MTKCDSIAISRKDRVGDTVSLKNYGFGHNWLPGTIIINATVETLQSTSLNRIDLSIKKQETKRTSCIYQYSTLL